MNETTDDVKAVARLFSAGNLVTLIICLAGTAYGYGNMAQKVDGLQDAVIAVQARDITPGAAQEIASIKAVDISQDRAIMELREEIKESRKEVLNAVQDVGSKIDRHMNEQRR